MANNMPDISDEIKSRTEGLSKAPSTLAGLIKSKITNARVINRVALQLSRKIGPEGIVGSKNFDTHTNTIKKFLKAGKAKEALSYVKEQSAKVRQRVKDEKKAKAQKKVEKDEMLRKFSR